jgi:transcriptional regulator with XRE-family HTH domain
MVRCTLKSIMAQRGLSQRALAHLSTLNRQTIIRYCRDEWHQFDRHTLDRLCHALQVSPGRLFTWDHEDR